MERPPARRVLPAARPVIPDAASGTQESCVTVPNAHAQVANPRPGCSPSDSGPDALRPGLDRHPDAWGLLGQIFRRDRIEDERMMMRARRKPANEDEGDADKT
jgi:hypothetical protein